MAKKRTATRKKAAPPKTKKKSDGAKPGAQKIPPGFELRHTLRGHESAIWEIAWSPDGRTLASASDDHTIRLWDADGGRLVRTLKGHGGYVGSVSWSPDGTALASGSNDKTVRLWDAASGKLRKALKEHGSSVYTVSWSPDGTTLVSGSFDGTIRLWAAARGKLRKTLKERGGGVYAVSWSPDGTTLASGSGDSTIRLWDPDGGGVVRTLKGHGARVFSLSWSPDGRMLASGSGDKTIRLWDANDGRQLSVLEGHTAVNCEVHFSPDARLLASKSWDNTVRLWRPDTAETVAIIDEPYAGGKLGGLAFHPTEPILATLGEGDRGPDTVIRIWRLDYGVLLGAAPSPESMRYANAKVVLVGDTGVGKTALSRALTEKEFIPTESTHGRRVITLDKTDAEVKGGVPIARETLLWDLAGQPGYRLVHQIQMDEAAVALVMFDARSETDPFGGAEYWSNALSQARTNVPIIKLLVAARADRGGVGISKERVDRFVAQHGFTRFFRTSAKTGEGVQELVV